MFYILDVCIYVGISYQTALSLCKLGVAIYDGYENQLTQEDIEKAIADSVHTSTIAKAVT